MRAFVTGSTGLLGNNLVRELLDEGHDVVGLTRSEAKFERMLGDTRAEPCVGDMLAIDDFAAALDEVDVVFHTAAYFREYYQSGDRLDRMTAINVDATLRLMEFADRRGVGVFVHTSSAGTIGHTAEGLPGDEDTPASAEQLENLYFRSKVQGDAKIRAFTPPGGMRVVQILPAWMWGPGDAGPTGAGQIALELLSGSLPAVPRGGTSIVDARDVARAMVRAVGQPHGERFIVGGRFHTLREIIDTLARVSGRPAPRIDLPVWAALLYATLAETWARISRAPRSAASVAGVKTMALNHSVRSDKAERVLGAQFRDFEETARDLVAWYRAEGMV